MNTLYMLGFMPGFPFLVVYERIHTPEDLNQELKLMSVQLE